MTDRADAARKGWATRRLKRVDELQPKLARRANQPGMAENALAIKAEIARLKDLAANGA